MEDHTPKSLANARKLRRKMSLPEGSGPPGARCRDRRRGAPDARRRGGEREAEGMRSIAPQSLPLSGRWQPKGLTEGD